MRKKLKHFVRKFKAEHKHGKALIKQAVAARNYRLAYELSEQNEMLAKVIRCMRKDGA